MGSVGIKISSVAKKKSDKKKSKKKKLVARAKERSGALDHGSTVLGELIRSIFDK